MQSSRPERHLGNAGRRGAELPLTVRQQSAARARHRRCLLYTSPSPRDRTRSRMPSSA